MAVDDVTPTAAAEPSSLAPLQRRSVGAKAYENRFAIAYVGLAVVVAGAIIAFAVVMKDGGKTALRWSVWQPNASGIDGTRQIADHVARRYRSEGGTQLTTNLIAPFQIQQAPISAVAIRNDVRGSDNQFYNYSFPTNVPFTLCGLGTRCAIASGKPSLARGRLVRRQALELALYTFTYIKGSQSVLEYLPPAAGNQLTYAMFLRKSDVKGALEQPLRETLPGTPPFTASTKLQDDPAIDNMLQEHVFRVDYTQIPDGSVLTVLSPREITS